MKKIMIWALAALPLIAAGQTIATKKTALSKEIAVPLQKLTQFYTYLAGSYIDSLDMGQLAEDAIKQTLGELDPHSAYFSADEMKGIRESMQGNFSGIGVQINMVDDTLHIENIIPGGPSEKVGLQPNDRIVTVNDTSVVGWKQIDIVGRLRGLKGTPVNIGIIRPGEEAQLNFSIVRGDIPINTVDASYKPDKKTGYIKVNRFAHTTMKELEEAFDKLGNIDGLILDLRGNGGGLLAESIDMAGFFLSKDHVIVSTDGRVVRPEQYKSKGNGKFRKGKLVVLVDEFSASASEIVSGALQDWDRAVIVGRRTYGKGLVQRQYPLADGSAVNITVSRYITPAGRTIQRPFKKGDKEGYMRDFEMRFKNDTTAALPQVDSAGFYTTLRLGKKVYGGGGITPDYIVEADTTGGSPYERQLASKGIYREYIGSYLDRNRNVLTSGYADFEAFRDNFTVTDEMVEEFAALAEKRGIAPDEEGLAKSRQRISRNLKSMIAGTLWSTSEAYQILNENDPVYLKGLEIIRDWKKMADGIATDHI